MKLKTFEEWSSERLFETPIKILGDAPFEPLHGLVTSKDEIDKNWDKLGKIKDFELYSFKKRDLLILGKFVDTLVYGTKEEVRFARVAELSFTHKILTSKQKQLNGKEIININTIHVEESQRRNKLSSELYFYLLQEYLIFSDKIQYENAYKMWKNFASIKGVFIYIYDSKEDKIISRLTTKTPDEHVWSLGEDNDYTKHRIQLILTNTKF